MKIRPLFHIMTSLRNQRALLLPSYTQRNNLQLQHGCISAIAALWYSPCGRFLNSLVILPLSFHTAECALVLHTNIFSDFPTASGEVFLFSSWFEYFYQIIDLSLFIFFNNAFMMNPRALIRKNVYHIFFNTIFTQIKPLA